MTIQNYPVILDKSKNEIVPVLSTTSVNGEIVEAMVWDDDDVIVLEKGEFEVIEYNAL